MDIQSIQNSIQPKERNTASTVGEGKTSPDMGGISKVQVSEDALKKVGANSSKETVVNKEKMDQLLSDVNEQLQLFNSYLKLEKDEDTQKTVFFIKNTETDEVLRQFPSEELLTMSKNITEYLETVQKSDSAGKNPSPVGLITSQVV